MPNAPGTTNTPFRLTESDRAKFRALMRAWHLPNMAAVLRKLIDEAHERLTREPKETGR